MGAKDLKDPLVEVPDRPRCFELLREHNVPDHVISHSVQVCRVALFLGCELNKRGEDLDLSLVEASALLHDITKIRGLNEGSNHARTASELLESLGFHRVAEVVSHHVVVPQHKCSPDRVSEDELVNYSDKRVMHDRIVTLEERFADLERRYGGDPRSRVFIDEALRRARGIENKIFERLRIEPSMLESAMETKRSRGSLFKDPKVG